MKDFVKERLQSLLENLDNLFQDNELAYFSSQCKNELQIRDRIAWRLHQDITKEYGDLYGLTCKVPCLSYPKIL